MQDEFLKRLAEDTVLYVRTVCNTIIMEVPKAIVHCQVSLSSLPNSDYLLLITSQPVKHALLCTSSRARLELKCYQLT